MLDFSTLSDDQIKTLSVLLQQQLEANKVSFSDQVASVQQQRMDARMKELQHSVSQIETVNAAFQVCLNEILGDIAESRRIVTQLDKCRRENDFRRFNTIRFQYSRKDLKIREMLHVLAAIYRLKMKKYNKPQYKYQDRSIVRKHIECPHCGEYAKKLVDYLGVKGIHWAN